MQGADDGVERAMINARPPTTKTTARIAAMMIVKLFDMRVMTPNYLITMTFFTLS
jgi:hypothetical protein